MSALKEEILKACHAATRTSQADGETLVDLLSDDAVKGEYAGAQV